jgi:hypothetical protein
MVDASADNVEMQSILTDHAARYPSWTVEDVYKLIHQSALGSEHAVEDEDAARAWLSRELREMGAGPQEPLLDSISPDGLIVRVHLRPFTRRGLDGSLLLDAFLRTAGEFPGDAGLIMPRAEVAAELAREGTLRMGANDLTDFFGEMETRGFPAVHHSPAYQERYCPAYRVVARHLLQPDILAAV